MPAKGTTSSGSRVCLFHHKRMVGESPRIRTEINRIKSPGSWPLDERPRVGGTDGVRTRIFQGHILGLYQLSYRRHIGGWSRTRTLEDRSRLVYSQVQ